jgi:hypothetical protein
VSPLHSSSPAQDDDALRIRPMSDLWQEGWRSFLAMSVPTFGALGLVTATTGWWPAVLAGFAGATLVFALVAGRLRGSGVVLDADGIHERAYLRSTVFTPRRRVHQALVIPVGRTLLDEVTHQLFLLDRRGRTLLRMRGQLWDPRDLHAAATYFGVPVRILEPPMTWSELRRSPHRMNLEPWERHPFLTTAALVVLAIAVLTPALATVMTWLTL